MQNLEVTVNVLTTIGVAAYASAFVLLAARRQRVGMGLFVAGWLANGGLLIVNWIACGHPPLGNMYHVLVFLSLCFLPLYGIIRRQQTLSWLHLYFAFASCIPLLGTFFMERDILWKRVPALQSPWFVPHVFAYMVSYALAAVAIAVTTAGLLAARREGDTARNRASQAAYRILRMAFPFMTFGLLSGALWAEEAWGVYWSWDPKETWSLITWTLYVVYFHCRLNPALKRYATPAQAMAFAALVVTFLLVNLLPKLGSILHSYA